MTATEIVLLIVAIGMILLSFVGTDRFNEKVQEDSFHASNKVENYENIIKNTVNDATYRAILDTKEQMSKLSNEKIMAINEYSDQVLEKIAHNNKEAVFLYDMLNKKQEEIKTVLAKTEMIHRENLKLVKQMEQNTGSEVAEVPKKFNSTVNLNKKKNGSSKEIDKKKQVLNLFQEQRSIQEIAKELNMGQGEVKLILDMYANKKSMGVLE